MVLYAAALLSKMADRCLSGVLIAADTLGSYGTLARFKDVNRVGAYGSHTIVGAAGDLSDFQVCTQLSAIPELPYFS
jgi:20S proteasome alpha/beta subunit